MRRRALLVLALVVCAPASARAQRELDVERFVPAPDDDGFVGVSGTRTPGPWRWNLALWVGYARSPLTAQLPDGSLLGIVSDRLGANLLYQIGVLGRFAVVLDWPAVLYQAGDPTTIDGGGGLTSVALRDPRIAVRARLLGEDATEERERHEGEGLALQVAGRIPIGQEQAFAGEGAAQLEAQLLGDFHLLDFGVGGAFGVRHRFAEPRVLGVPFRNELFFALAIQVPAFVVDDVLGIAELHVTTDLENPFGSASSTAVEWLFGIRGRLRDARLTLAGGSGLTSGVGTSAFRIVAGIDWAPRVHDRDRDRILDEQDGCPTLPEDVDRHEDDDGCPEPDNDGDLVPDLDDRCPNEAAHLGRDLDDDGCDDPDRDADDDGVEDAQDRCPDDREDRDGHEDDDGCLDADDDADGVPDEADACRSEPEDRDGTSDADGCPDLDDDADGVPQGDDRCEGAAEDRDGHDDADGCPDPDDDRDGVLDADDRCADVREDLDGRDDHDGCPERGGRSAWRRSGTPGQSDFALEGAIRFARDGSVAAASRGPLEELARHLVAAWGTRVRLVIGRGNDAQIAALRAALAALGVAVDLLEITADPAVRGVRVQTLP